MITGVSSRASSRSRCFLERDSSMASDDLITDLKGKRLFKSQCLEAHLHASPLFDCSVFIQLRSCA